MTIVVPAGTHKLVNGVMLHLSETRVAPATKMHGKREALQISTGSGKDHDETWIAWDSNGDGFRVDVRVVGNGDWNDFDATKRAVISHVERHKFLVNHERFKSGGTVHSMRAPPKGGLDLRAMSAAWRKAGKPGDWRSWCKVHPIKASK